MTPEDWEALNMRPPSATHDPFHGYVSTEGEFTEKGCALLNFAKALADHAATIRTGKTQP